MIKDIHIIKVELNHLYQQMIQLFKVKILISFWKGDSVASMKTGICTPAQIKIVRWAQLHA